VSNCCWKVFFFWQLLLPRQSWILAFCLHKIRELLDKMRNGGPCNPQHLVVNWSHQVKDMCRGRAIGAVTRLWAGRTEFQEVQKASLWPNRPDHLFDTPKQLTTQLMPGTLSSQIKRTGSDPDHSHISPRLQNRGPIPLLPHTPSQRARRPYFTRRKMNHTWKLFFIRKILQCG